VCNPADLFVVLRIIVVQSKRLLYFELGYTLQMCASEVHARVEQATACNLPYGRALMQRSRWYQEDNHSSEINRPTCARRPRKVAINLLVHQQPANRREQVVEIFGLRLR